MKKIPALIHYNNAVVVRLKNKRITILDGEPFYDAPDVIAYNIIITQYDPLAEREICAHGYRKGKTYTSVIHLTEETLFAIVEAVRIRQQELKNK